MADASKSGMITAISEDSRVKLGFAIATLFAIGWWAASIQSKIDVLIMSTQTVQTINSSQDAKLQELEKRILTTELKLDMRKVSP